MPGQCRAPRAVGPPRNVEYCLRREGHDGLHQWPQPDSSWVVVGGRVRLLVEVPVTYGRPIPAGAVGAITRLYPGDDLCLYVEFADVPGLVRFYSNEFGMLLEVLPP